MITNYKDCMAAISQFPTLWRTKREETRRLVAAGLLEAGDPPTLTEDGYAFCKRHNIMTPDEWERKRSLAAKARIAIGILQEECDEERRWRHEKADLERQHQAEQRAKLQWARRIHEWEEISDDSFLHAEDDDLFYSEGDLF